MFFWSLASLADYQQNDCSVPYVMTGFVMWALPTGSMRTNLFCIDHSKNTTHTHPPTHTHTRWTWLLVTAGLRTAEGNILYPVPILAFLLHMWVIYLNLQHFCSKSREIHFLPPFCSLALFILPDVLVSSHNSVTSSLCCFSLHPFWTTVLPSFCSLLTTETMALNKMHLSKFDIYKLKKCITSISKTLLLKEEPFLSLWNEKNHGDFWQQQIKHDGQILGLWARCFSTTQAPLSWSVNWSCPLSPMLNSTSCFFKRPMKHTLSHTK